VLQCVAMRCSVLQCVAEIERSTSFQRRFRRVNVVLHPNDCVCVCVSVRMDVHVDVCERERE